VLAVRAGYVSVSLLAGQNSPRDAADLDLRCEFETRVADVLGIGSLHELGLYREPVRGRVDTRVMYKYEQPSLFSGKRGLALIAVIILHVLIGWAFYSGLAMRLASNIIPPVEIAQIEKPKDVDKPPPPPGRPHHPGPPVKHPPQPPLPPPPPPPCGPNEVRRVDTGQCTPGCQRPDIQIGGRCCKPGTLAAGGPCSNSSCQPGQTAIGPSNFCCNSGNVYTGTNGAPACCSGTVVNGQCQPPAPPNCPSGSHNPNCPVCASGYVQAGSSCCLAGTVTSNGTCCPAGQAPGGTDNSLCVPVLHIPNGPSCCASGLIPTASGACCAPANVTTAGVCCAHPITSADRSQCPATLQLIPPVERQCAAGYQRMPDGSCCNRRYVSEDGRICRTGRPPCPSGEIRDAQGSCVPVPVPVPIPVPAPLCPPGTTLARDGACVVGREPCPQGEHRNRDGVCTTAHEPCPRGEHHGQNGECVPTSCPNGRTRGGNGKCVTGPVRCPEREHRDADGVCVKGEHPSKCREGWRQNDRGICVKSAPPVPRNGPSKTGGGDKNGHTAGKGAADKGGTHHIIKRKPIKRRHDEKRK